MQRLRTYSGRLRYLRDPVVTLVIPLLVGIESLLFLYWRETSLGIEGVPARLPLTLELWWFDSDFGMPMQTFVLIFHPVLVVFLWLRCRLTARDDLLATATYVGCGVLLAACQAMVVAFSKATPKFVLEQIYP